MTGAVTRISGVRLFPGVEGGRALPMVERGCALVRDGRFLYAGPEEEAPDAQAVETLDGRGMLLMPALANAHAHSAMTLLRGAGAELPLREWLFQVIFPLEKRLDSRAAHAGVALAAMEYLRCGVTAVNDMYMFPEDTAQALGECGLRTLITNACVEFGDGERQLEEALRFYRDYHGSFGGRVRAGISVHAEYTSTPALVRRLVKAAEGLDNVAHVHVSETEREVKECIARHGKSPVRYFHDLGLFGMPAVAAHCLAVDGEDLDLLAKDGVTAALNPVSNLKLGSGVAPVERMLSHGVRLAVGTDGAASNDSLDLFEEMKLTGILPKGVRGDPTLVPPEAVFEAASRGGFAAMGFPETGLVRTGWQADCVLLDLDAPNLACARDFPAALVYAARGENVRLTMAAGRVLYRDGEYLTLDAARAVAGAKEASRRLRLEA